MGVDSTAVATVNRTHPEPLLDENPNRFTMFPIKYADIWVGRRAGCPRVLRARFQQSKYV